MRNCSHPKNETHEIFSDLALRVCKSLDKDLVYVGMRLVGKIISCVVDTVCYVTVVPQYANEKHMSIRMTVVLPYAQVSNARYIEKTGEVALSLMSNDRCIML